MQISLKWINELLNIEIIELDNLIERLTLGGFEVEEILEIEIDNQKQTVLDISATANRSDSLSIQGISREIAALLNQPTKKSDYRLSANQWKKEFENQQQIISKNSDYVIFLSVIIENLTNVEVPKWITQKLRSSSVVPANNLSDFQNYILLETGYPFEFYDLQKLRSQLNSFNFDLSITNELNNQRFLASNDLSYSLDSKILTVTANDLPISIAGVIEAKNFSISKDTNSLLIEASIFNASKIRQQSRCLGLRTDRSARYEKSLRNTYLLESLYRLISLLRILNPDLMCKLHTLKQIDEKPLNSIILRYDTITEILGPITRSKNLVEKYMSPKLVTEYLTRLKFRYFYDERQLTWTIQVPHSRAEDLTREIDLIEEIGRFHGFNNFLTTLPKINSIGNEDSTYKARKKITACLGNLGFNELIHYSLVNQESYLSNEVKLINPLLSDCSSLRSSLLPNLIQTVQENSRQKNLVVEGFEYGHVFLFDASNKFTEKEYLAGIFGGKKTKLAWTDPENGLNWFEAKGKMEQFFHQLNLFTYWQKSSNKMNEKIFHPYRSANIYFSNRKNLGRFGQIHPILANKLNLASEIYLFEFDLESITSQLQLNQLTLYKSYSLYPKIIKDLSFIIQKDISFDRIKETLYFNGTNILSEINLLDEYQGKSIPADQRSLCLQLIFQSKNRTLENKEIETIIQKLQLILRQIFHASLRD